MLSIGDRLRRERLRRGLDIDQLAEQTKINPAMLEAIEADDLDRLPGSFFTRSFVRQYAKALDLDDDDLETELKRVTGGDEPPAMEFPLPERELDLPPVTPSRRRGPGRHSFSALFALIVIVGACSLIYTSWQKTRAPKPPAQRSAARQAPAAKPQPAKPPAQQQAQSAAPVRTSASGTATTASGAAPESKPAAGSPDQPANPATPAQTPTPETAEPVAPANPGGPFSSVPPGEAAGVKVDVHAAAEAWVQVSGDGQRLFTGILQPSETRTFEGKGRLSIKFGDPAAVQVTWNGKEVGEIGPQGKPRTVQFTPDAFRVLTPAPPTPPAENDGL